jgi:hypothetical protein
LKERREKLSKRLPEKTSRKRGRRKVDNGQSLRKSEKVFLDESNSLQLSRVKPCRLIRHGQSMVKAWSKHG